MSSGQYDYLVMPCGLTNVPADFQSFINKIFRDLLNHCVIVYIDNILIYSSYDSHFEHVHMVLNCLLQHHVIINGKKCEFQQYTIIFLRYIISNWGRNGLL